MKPRNLLPLLLFTLTLILLACNTPARQQSAPEDDLGIDLSGSSDSDENDPDFTGLGFTWDEEMPGGPIRFHGTIATCNIPGPWDVSLVITGFLGPENHLTIAGNTEVDIPQVGDDRFVGTFTLPMVGALSDPECAITYDLQMEMSVIITPYSLEIVNATAHSQIISASCPDLGATTGAPELRFPTDFVVAPMGTFDCPSQ